MGTYNPVARVSPSNYAIALKSKSKLLVEMKFYKINAPPSASW